MGRSHAVTVPQNYLYCPPASGTHLNAAGLGPIQPRVYKPDDKVGPPNWVHNLEHGGMVVLYRNDSPGATAAGQPAFTAVLQQPSRRARSARSRPARSRRSSPGSTRCRTPTRRSSGTASCTWTPGIRTWRSASINEESERLDSNGDLVAPPEDAQGAPPGSSPSASPGREHGRVGRADAPRRPRRRRPLPARSRRRARADRRARRRRPGGAPATGIARGSRRVGCATLRACAPS